MRRRAKNLLVLDSTAGRVNRKKSKMVPVGYQYRRMAAIAAFAALGVAVVLFVVWGIASIVTDILYPPISEESGIVIEVDKEAANYTDKDAFDMLILKVSDDGLTAEQSMLARFEPSEERVYVTVLHPQTVFEGDTLAEHYRKGGTARCAEVMAREADCDEVFTVAMTYVQIRLLINELGGVTFYVPQTVNYIAEKADRNVNIAKGEREYTGGETARLLNFPGWEGGDAQHRQMYCTVLEALIDQNLKTSKAGKLKNMYLKLYSGSQADMSMTDFHDKLLGLTYLAEHNDEDGSLTMNVEIKTKDNGDGTYSLTEDGAKLLRAVFGRRDFEQ